MDAFQPLPVEGVDTPLRSGSYPRRHAQDSDSYVGSYPRRHTQDSDSYVAFCGCASTQDIHREVSSVRFTDSLDAGHSKLYTEASKSFSACLALLCYALMLCCEQTAMNRLYVSTTFYNAGIYGAMTSTLFQQTYLSS